MARKNVSLKIEDPMLAEMLVFLSAPKIYYESYKAGHWRDHPLASYMHLIDENYPSVFKDTSENPLREKLKSLFDKISENAQSLALAGTSPHGMPKAMLSRKTTAIHKALVEIKSLKNRVFGGSQYESGTEALYQKFFEGGQTLDAVFINMASHSIHGLEAIEAKAAGLHERR